MIIKRGMGLFCFSMIFRNKVIPILLITASYLFAVSCSKSDYKVKVKYTNATGSEIEGLKIGDQRIGKLGIDEETKNIPYQEFRFDSGLPDEPIVGKIDGEKTLDYSTFYDCGTQKYALSEGSFEIEIKKVEIDDKTYLLLNLK
jgi:hypothetical protein